MRQSSDFDDAIADELRDADAFRGRARRDRLFRVFSTDEPFSEPDDDTDASDESEAAS